MECIQLKWSYQRYGNLYVRKNLGKLHHTLLERADIFHGGGCPCKEAT
jgi:hypothetical protein